MVHCSSSEPGQQPDAATDHTFVIGQGPDRDKDPILLNGVSELPKTSWRIGSQQRVRLIGITGVQTVRVRPSRDSRAVTWRALAKDGADLPAALATVRTAEVDLSPGETWDFVYGADGRGTLRLEAAVPKSEIPVASASIAVE
jgi:hypothetical protein